MSATVVAFCVEGVSHAQNLLAVVAGLQERGVTAHVMTSQDLKPQVERFGAHFIDLFDGRPIGDVDDESYPLPSRNVTFAGVHGERLAAEVAGLEPSLILYEMFSVMGPVVARQLGLPYVNVICGHAPVPARTVAARRRATKVFTSPRCWAAVERLREVHGIENAGPFYYLEAVSPHLNVYGEPPQFLPTEDRAAFEPLAFFGSLTPEQHAPRPAGRRVGSPRRLLISFGTILWRYFEAEALAILETLAESCAALEGLEATISLGGHRIDRAARAALARDNVEVVDYLDQTAVLAETDVFLTHHGLNSTHEAIFQQVPMMSCPFYGDQPAQARQCQELGLAVPLGDRPGGDVGPEALGAALRRIDEDRAGFAARLAEARGWELETIAGRGKAVDRILGLSGPTP